MKNVQAIKSALEMKEFVVEKVYMNNYNPQFIKNCPPEEYNMGFELSYQEQEDNVYKVNVSLKVDIDDDTDEILLEVGVYGIFELHNSGELKNERKQKIIEINTASILFPYLRSLVTTISANSGIPPLILPTINMGNLIQKQKGDVPAEE